ncbi:MAG: hypothetical protein KC656_31820, partial [Myxococcales bacterium]|nr:hypothetical protein [Myxococcales bacterium]
MIPDVYRDQGPTTLRRARLVVMCTLVIMPAVPAYMLVHWLQGTPWTMQAVLAFWFVAALLPITALQRGAPLTFLGFWAGMCLVGLQTSTAIVLGTGRAGDLIWAALAPFAAMAIGGRRISRVLLVLALVACLGVLIGQHVQWLPGPLDPNPRFGREILMAVAVTVVVFLLGHVYEEASELAVSAVRASNTALQAEVVEHEATREKLEQTYADLLTSARLAGMAEVATGVLHNIGNGLTSVKVSTDLVRARTADRRMETSLRRAAELLDGDLDSSSREQLRRFLHKLADQSARAREETRDEIRRISERVEHVATIVTVQQAHARAHAVIEDVPIAEAVEEAMLLADPGSIVSWQVEASVAAVG